jgi:hypothetical protein
MTVYEVGAVCAVSTPAFAAIVMLTQHISARTRMALLLGSDNQL